MIEGITSFDGTTFRWVRHLPNGIIRPSPDTTDAYHIRWILAWLFPAIHRTNTREMMG